MNRLAHISILVLVGLITACSQAQYPTGPSPAATPLFGGDLSQSATARVVDWSALTATGGDYAPSITGADAPGAPSNLAFTVSGTTVILTWRAPGAGGAVASFVLEAGTSAGLSNIASFNTGSTATTFTATGVPNGSYFVRVRARNADGTSGPSNEVTIVFGGGGGPTPPPPPPPPTPPCAFAPTGLTGEASGNMLVLRWTGVGGAIAYIIEAGTTSGASNLSSFDTGSSTSSFTATVPSGTYYIRVRTRAACGTSGVSNQIVITVTGGAAPPTATGRWVGVSPDGMIADGGQIHCPVEFDLTMDLTVIGGTVSGTATTRIRRVQFSACPPVGNTVTYGVAGTVGSDGTISMQFGTGSAAYTLTGTFSATRMSGRWVQQATSQRGAFAVNKQ